MEAMDPEAIVEEKRGTVFVSAVTLSGVVELESKGVLDANVEEETLTLRAEKGGSYVEANGRYLYVKNTVKTIDGKTIRSADDVRQALNHSAGRIRLEYQRNGKTQTLDVTPAITENGPKLGVFLKQGITGIGTVTWYDPQTQAFGSLGHGVCGNDGQPLQLVSGTAYRAHVVSVKQGKCGEPGQLRGAVTDGQSVGVLHKNTGRGLFGTSHTPPVGQALEVATRDQIHTGPATILSTVAEESVREYSVEILKIYPKTKTGDRNMLLKVTDPALLAATGGIVQGMSGSPIIQDGKLIGAVTHVLVNDPTTGYGIFIENMLDAAA